jgi:hypothetical protein
VLGIAVAGDSHLIGGAYYHALARPWGPSLRLDQALGGGTLWVLGDLVGLPFLVAQLFHMIKEDESEAAEIDAELDAREARAAAVQQNAPVTVPADTPAQAGTPESQAGTPESQAGTPESQAGTPESQAGDPVPPDRPWWESDPRFTERFGRVGPRDQ